MYATQVRFRVLSLLLFVLLYRSFTIGGNRGKNREVQGFNPNMSVKILACHVKCEDEYIKNEAT